MFSSFYKYNTNKMTKNLLPINTTSLIARLIVKLSKVII